MQAKLGDRSLFQGLEACAYLNHSAISPPSGPVRAAAAEVLDSYARQGVSAFHRWLDQRGTLRGRLARLIGAEPDEVALISNTTRGVTDIALCTPWQRGERVVVFQGEFPANVTPWQRAAQLFELDLVMLPQPVDHEGAPDLGRLEATLQAGRVRMVALSVVQFQTGRAMPVADVAALCHHHGAELFVDAIQAVGVVPVDVHTLGVDYLTCGSHKWLMGTEGAGFLYARRGCAERLRPAVAGWLSHQDALRFLFEGPGHLRYDRPIRRTLDFVEGGAPNTVGFAALGASLALIEQLGVPTIHAHVTAYLDRLEAGLLDRGFTSARTRQPAPTGILSVRPAPPQDAIALQRALSANGVACTAPDGWLRFAPHWPNAHDEVDLVLATLDDAVADV